MSAAGTGADGAFRDADATARVVYERSGIGDRVGYGTRPALLIVDLQNGFTDPASPVGADLTDVVEAADRLLSVARRRKLPIAYTAVGFDAGLADGSTWLRKMPGLASLVQGTRWCEIDTRVQPHPGEPVWVKRAASGFFGTPLIPFLVAQQIDTLIVTGCVTSGCVRATVVDAVSWGYRTIVPLEAVGDRSTGVHQAALFDIDAKYGDVDPLENVLEFLETGDEPVIEGVPERAQP
jgi:nicotinamidase-related amidase